jgi:two-component system, OmpR family, phosphate regulon sensor histidine kinase PhoR
MRLANNIRWIPLVMGVTIVGITAFQLFWLHSTYEREARTLEIRSNMAFKETVHNLQAAHFEAKVLAPDSVRMPVQALPQATKDGAPHADGQVVALVNVLRDRVADSVADRINRHGKRDGPHRDRLVRLLYDMDSVQDSVQVQEIKTAFAEWQNQQNMQVPFAVQRFNREREGFRVHNEVTLGLLHPITYRLQLHQTQPYLLRRILSPIFLSLFIVGFTILSFILLYRNLLRQRRLAEIKNELISNITHELKTPIATVSVAIESLRLFNASTDPQRTKEYLDISHNELQRLSLLVDKVLKLSMFEKKEVELRYEQLYMKDLVAEVTASMRLQFEKYGAHVAVQTEGSTMLEGDRLHLVSVIFNLLDNALKYSATKPEILIFTKDLPGQVQLHIKDNGIGIPKEHHSRVFEKFFRVPTGNLHNAKGYGLGLSYVAQVVAKHKGNIRIEPGMDGGSCFVITLPKNPA